MEVYSSGREELISQLLCFLIFSLVFSIFVLEYFNVDRELQCNYILIAKDVSLKAAQITIDQTQISEELKTVLNNYQELEQLHTEAVTNIFKTYIEDLQQELMIAN